MAVQALPRTGCVTSSACLCWYLGVFSDIAGGKAKRGHSQINGRTSWADTHSVLKQARVVQLDHFLFQAGVLHHAIRLSDTVSLVLLQQSASSLGSNSCC